MDYEELAKKYGGTVTKAPTVDYATLATKFNGTVSTVPPVPPVKPGLLQEAYMGGINKSAEGVNQIFEGVNLDNPNPALVGRGILNSTAGFVEAAFSPISATFNALTGGKFSDAIGKMQKSLEENPDSLPNKISDWKPFQEFAKNNPNAGEVFANMVTIGSTLIGGAKAPAIKGAITKPLTEVETAITSKALQMAETKTLNKALDTITPRANELTPTAYKKLVSQGRIEPKTLTQPSKYILSDGEKAVAQKYSNLLQDSDPVVTSIKVMDEIAAKDAQVGKFLSENNGIFNKGELKNYLSEKLQVVDDITVPEERLLKAKDTLINNFIVKLSKNDKVSLWQARKAFDQTIDSAFKGSPTLAKQMKIEFRNAVQDFIAETTPDGVYKGLMTDMRQLYRINDVVTARASKTRSLNRIQKWYKENPVKAKLLGFITGYEIAKKTGLVP